MNVLHAQYMYVVGDFSHYVKHTQMFAEQSLTNSDPVDATEQRLQDVQWF